MNVKIIIMAILIGGSAISCSNTSNSTQERSKKDMTEIIGKAKKLLLIQVELIHLNVMKLEEKLTKLLEMQKVLQ